MVSNGTIGIILITHLCIFSSSSRAVADATPHVVIQY